MVQDKENSVEVGVGLSARWPRVRRRVPVPMPHAITIVFEAPNNTLWQTSLLHVHRDPSKPTVPNFDVAEYVAPTA